MKQTSHNVIAVLIGSALEIESIIEMIEHVTSQNQNSRRQSTMNH